MPFLTVDLEDDASAGLDALAERIEQTGKSADTAARDYDKLTESQKRQIIVVNQTRSALGEMGIAGTKALGSLGAAGIKAFSDIEVASTKAGAAIVETTVKSIASVAKYAIVGATAASGIKAVWAKNSESVDKHKKKVEEAEDAEVDYVKVVTNGLAGLAAARIAAAAAYVHGLDAARIATATATKSMGGSWNSVGKVVGFVGQKTVTMATGTGEVLLGLKIAFAGLDAVLARTGARMIELEDGTKKIETNFDRLSVATGELKSTIARDFAEAGAAIKELMAGPWFDFSFGIIEKLDKDITQRTDIAIENVGLLAKAYENARDALRANLIVGGEEAVRMKAFEDQQAKDQAKLQEYFDKTAVGRERLRAMDDKLRESEEKKSEAERQNSIRSVAQIDAEIQKLRDKQVAIAKTKEAQVVRYEKPEMPGAKATDKDKEKYKADLEAWKQNEAAVKKAEDQLKEYGTTLERLTKRRKEIPGELFAERARAHAAQLKLDGERWAALGKMREEEEKVTKAVRERTLAYRDLQREFMQSISAKAFEADADSAKQLLGIQKDLIAQRMQMNAGTQNPIAVESNIKSTLADLDKKFSDDQHNRRLQQIESENKAALAAIDQRRRENERNAKDGYERRITEAKLRQEVDKIEFDTKKKRVDEISRYAREKQQIELSDYQQKEIAKLNLAKERMEKEKAIQRQALEKTFDQQSLMNASDPRKVFNAVREERARKAQQEQAKKDAALHKKAKKGDLQAAARFKRNQIAARNRGFGSFNRDLQQGKINQGEVAQAQGKLATETIQAFGQQGKLNADQVKFMVEATQTAANQQQAISNLQTTVTQLTNYQKGIKQQATKSAQQTQNQMGALQY